MSSLRAQLPSDLRLGNLFGLSLRAACRRLSLRLGFSPLRFGGFRLGRSFLCSRLRAHDLLSLGHLGLAWFKHHEFNRIFSRTFADFVALRFLGAGSGSNVDSSDELCSGAELISDSLDSLFMALESRFSSFAGYIPYFHHLCQVLSRAEG